MISYSDTVLNFKQRVYKTFIASGSGGKDTTWRSSYCYFFLV